MTDTPALVRRLREYANKPKSSWFDESDDLLREAANALDALSLGVVRQPEPDNDVGLAEERRQFNVRIGGLEQERDAYIRRWQDESRYHDMYCVKHDEAEKRAEAAEQALVQLRSALKEAGYNSRESSPPKPAPED